MKAIKPLSVNFRCQPLACFGLAVCFSLPVRSETLPPVAVSESRSQAISQYAYREADRQTLAATQQPNLNGVLRGFNGLQVFQSTPGSPSGMTIDGASGGLGLLTLDGVPLFASITGMYALQQLPAELFQSLEVQRGPGGERYGSRTLGGAIHLHSRELADNAGFVKLEGGNYDTVRGGFGKGWETPFGQWTLLGERQAVMSGYSQAAPSNGNHENDNYQLNNVLLRGRRDFSAGDADATLLYTKTRTEMDGPGVLPNGKLGWMDDLQGLADDRTWLAQGRVRQQLNERWLSTLQVGMTQNRQSVNLTRLPYFYNGRLWLARWQNRNEIRLPAASQAELALHWGVELQQQHAESISRLRQVARTLSSAEWFLRSEGRWRDWQAQAETRFDWYDIYGSRLLFNLRLGWSPSHGQLLWVGGGTGFRPPAVNESLNPLFGNANLNPERSAGGEIGWRWQDSDSKASVIASYHDYRQLIVMKQDSATGINRSANLARAEIWSLSGELTQRWHARWQSGLTYTFMPSRNEATGSEVPLRPLHQGRFWNQWQLSEPLSLRLELDVRDRFWFDSEHTGHNTPAARLNAIIRYQASDNLQLYLQGQNLNGDRSPDVANLGYPGAVFWGGFKLEL